MFSSRLAFFFLLFVLLIFPHLSFFRLPPSWFVELPVSSFFLSPPDPGFPVLEIGLLKNQPGFPQTGGHQRSCGNDEGEDPGDADGRRAGNWYSSCGAAQCTGGEGTDGEES